MLRLIHPVLLNGRRASVLAALVVVCLAASAAPSAIGDGPPDRHQAPKRSAVESWLGKFAAGNERLALSWNDQLILGLGAVQIPVDGQWHETVATFAVRHRASWLPEHGALGLEERHDEGHAWRYWLRLDAGGEILIKTPWPEPGLDDAVSVLRRFRRTNSTGTPERSL